MPFMPKDRVVCLTPVNTLVSGHVYEVTKVFGDGNDQILALDNEDHMYKSFRFRLYNGDEVPPQAVDTTAMALPIVYTNTTINYVDQGMVSNTAYCAVTDPKVDVSLIAAKYDQDKVDLSLIPSISNIEHAKAFMVGEKKYGRNNYCKGQKASRLVAAIKRHVDAWFDGEDHDPKDGQHHLGAVMANCSMILRQEQLGTLIDDRYKPEITK